MLAHWIVWIKNNKIPLLIFIALSFFTIIKVFFVPQCLAFDPNDDRNHTFVNLLAAKNILTAGQVPQINFFNNFGTPILGDGLTYPFATQALTYYFFDGPLAMTVNRFVLTFATLLVLYIFFRSYFSHLVSTLVAAFAFYTPGFLWHFAHHHYQASLLFFVLALILISRFAQEQLAKQKFLFWLFIVLTLFILSVSINLVAIALPLLLIASALLPNKNWRKSLAATASAIFAALFITAPQTLAFVQAISSSVRLQSTFIENTAYANYNIFRVVLGMLTQVHAGGGHIEVALYFSLTALISALIGCLLLLKEQRRLGLLALFLGILPVFAVALLLSLPTLWAKMPLIKSIDITRLWWFSNVFLGLALGKFLEELLHRRLTKHYVLLALITTSLVLATLFVWQYSCSIGISLFGRCGPTNAIWPIYKWHMVLFLFLLVTYLFLQKSNNLTSKFLIPYSLFLILVFALSILPNPIKVFHLNEPGCPGHWFGFKNRAGFQPPEFLKLMQPYHRLATEAKSSDGQDLTAIFGNILGSNGRSIIMDKALTDYLSKENLIEIDDRLSGYHFKRPFQTEKLEQLGIRYIIASGTALELEQADWQKLIQKDNLVLYDNPKKPTPFYLKDENINEIQYLRDYQFKGNSVEIKLPPMTEAKTLIATFVARPGWRVYVNGQQRSYSVGENRFLLTKISETDKTVEIIY